MIDIYTFWTSFYQLPLHLYIIYDILTLLLAIFIPLATFFPFLALFGNMRKGGIR